MDILISLCRSRELSKAEAAFNSYVNVIPILTNTCGPLVNLDILQEICNYLRERPHQSLAHVAAHFGFNDCFKNSVVKTDEVNAICPDTHLTPLHLAIKSGRLQTVLILLSMNPKFNLVDKNGNNVLHLAASTSKEIISSVCGSILASSNSTSGDSPDGQVLSSPSAAANSPRDDTELLQLINARNKDNVSPIHLACISDKPDCVKALLKNGADVNGACIEQTCHRMAKSNVTSPGGSDSSPENFDKSMMDHLDPKDMKNGGNPLHWAKSPQCMEPLIEMGCNINAKNFGGETVLYVMVSRNKLPCVVTLLSYGADVNTKGPNGSTPLHVAVRSGDVTLVQSLIVFGAKLNVENQSGESPRHLAATYKRNSTQDTILYVLNSVGAKRCCRSIQGSPCTDGCSPTGVFNGSPPETAPFTRIKSLYDPLLARSIVKAAVAKKRKCLFASSAAAPTSSSTERMDIVDDDDTKNLDDVHHHKSPKKERREEEKEAKILSLDGGGIRGLVLIQMLSVLEEMMGSPVHSVFDWIAGTSTGGILALVLASGHTAAECRQFYFRMKNKVFIGTRPYESEPLEAFLKKTLGEETRMSQLVKPKVILTATVADKFPADLHLFRNYKSPHEIMGSSHISLSLPESPKPDDMLLWFAGRSSGAAPTYFRSCGRYLDGGLISNNPTLDVLTEITYWNAAWDATVCIV